MSRERAGKPVLHRGRAWTAGVLATAVLAATPHPVSAEPPSDREKLSAQEKRLVEQLGSLTEQHNGLLVRLKQAKRAAQVATAGVEREQKRLDQARSDVAGLAAEAYKQGGVDPTAILATSGDPQTLLDQVSVTNYLTAQNGTQVEALLQALQTFNRTRKAAQERVDQVERLSKEAARKQKRIQSLLKQVRAKLGKPEIGPKDPPPIVAPGGASPKALTAVKAALGQLGVPYSWGGGGPDGPTYGSEQGANIKGFDCSGLTLYAYAQVGINLPHYTGDQWKAGTQVGRDQLRPGDLVFFHADLHHMGMYIGDGKMVHAPQTGDVVKISPVDALPWAGAVRVA